ncbi:hypothetical protein ACFV46_20370 [Streptomyces sp. NPDC059852]|uniref:hypothetical protein n=1 Tax=Streptomyces sp. NPDC059852 TaxID=3346972 RepID=UPI0036464415
MRTTGLLGVLVMGLVAGGGTGVAHGAETARAAQGPTAGFRESPSTGPSADEQEGRGSGRPSHPAASASASEGPSAMPSRHGEHREHRGPDGREEAGDREWVRESWHSARHEPSPSASAHGPSAGRTRPSDEPSRAGSRPGEGRERPGRQKAPLEESEAAVRPAGDRDATAPPADEDTAAVPDDEDTADADATAQPSSRAADDAQGAGTRQRAQQPVLQVLPLGMGLVLVGLGLGLAFVGLRLRRG